MRRARPQSGREALAPLGTAVGQHLAAPYRRHPGTKAMPALADQFRGLIGALHGLLSIARSSAGNIAGLPRRLAHVTASDVPPARRSRPRQLRRAAGGGLLTAAKAGVNRARRPAAIKRRPGRGRRATWRCRRVSDRCVGGADRLMGRERAGGQHPGRSARRVRCLMLPLTRCGCRVARADRQPHPKIQAARNFGPTATGAHCNCRPPAT